MSRSTASTSTRPKKKATPRPPRGFINDGEYAHLRSLNILYDPGFELFMANSVEHWGNDEWLARTGSNQFSLPLYDSTCDYGQRWYNEDCVRYWDIAQWVQMGGPYEAGKSRNGASWNVSRFHPYLGDFHLAWWDYDSAAEYGGPTAPRPLMVQSPGLPPGYSARVKGGDMNSFSIRSNLAGVAAATPSVTLTLTYYTDAGSSIIAAQDQTAMTTYSDDYYEYRIDALAPSGSYFIRATVTFSSGHNWGSLNTPSVYVDSGVLSVW